MHPLDIAAPTANRDVPPPRLSGTIEGVEFWIVVSRGSMVRCMITESALQAHYGAQPDDPASWLHAFTLHHFDIERRALTATARRDDVHVVLVTDSAGLLKSVVGRCGP